MSKKLIAVIFGFCLAGVLSAASGKLEIYWIDAEGGAATLTVAPSGESLLVDTANRAPGDRDAKRIFDATQKAGLKKIDILLTTHFHSDHIGAMPALAKLIPIERYMDHGESVEMARPQVAAAYKAYTELSEGKRTILKAGDRIPLKGVDIEVIMSAGQAITKPLPAPARRTRLARTSRLTEWSPTRTTTRAWGSSCSLESSASSIWATLPGTTSRSWCAPIT